MDKDYRFSRNPSDGIDEKLCFCPEYGMRHRTDQHYNPEWGVWRTSYADHGGESG